MIIVKLALKFQLIHYNYLDTIRLAVEELTPSEAAEDRIKIIINNIVSGDGRQRCGLSCEDASLQLGQIIPGQPIRYHY